MNMLRFKKSLEDLVLVAVVLFMSACASTEERRAGFAAAMDAWVGKTGDELVQAKGPPTGSYTLSTGKRILEYLRKDTVTTGGDAFPTMTPVFVPNSGWVYVPNYTAYPVRSMTVMCKMLFTLSKDNVIEAWKAEGNDCY